MKKQRKCREIDKRILGEVHTSCFLSEVFFHFTDVIGPRFAGSSQESEAARYFAKQLSEAGLANADLEEFPLLGWTRLPGACLSLSSPVKRAFPITTLPYSAATGPGGLSAELAEVRYGTPEEFESLACLVRGRIVLTREGVPANYPRSVHRAEKFGRAVSAGAAGFLFANPEQGCLDQTGCARFGRKAEIPAAGVSKETADFLSRMMASGKVKANLKTPGKFRRIRSVNALAEIPGKSKKGGYLLVGGHVDSHDICPGALDNASGVSVMMEAARALKASGFKPEHTIRFAAFGSEEVGLAGSRAHVQAAGDGIGNLRLMINVDCPPLTMPMGFQFLRHEPARAWMKRVEAETGLEIPVLSGLHPHSDHFNFFRAGAPAANLAAPGLSHKTGRGFGHTAADTPDKVDVEGMKLCAGFLAMMLVRLGGTGGLRLPSLGQAQVDEILRTEGIAETLRYEE